MSAPRHTPTPWRFEPGANAVMAGDRTTIAMLGHASTNAESERFKADGQFISVAVNVHDELVAALKAVCGWSDDGGLTPRRYRAVMTAARAALAKAGQP